MPAGGVNDPTRSNGVARLVLQAKVLVWIPAAPQLSQDRLMPSAVALGAAKTVSSAATEAQRTAEKMKRSSACIGRPPPEVRTARGEMRRSMFPLVEVACQEIVRPAGWLIRTRRGGGWRE